MNFDHNLSVEPSKSERTEFQDSRDVSETTALTPLSLLQNVWLQIINCGGIVSGVGAGMMNKEISDLNNIPMSTVKKHMRD